MGTAPGDRGTQAPVWNESPLPGESPHLRFIERLLRAKATSPWSRHLLIIAGLMAGLGYVYYGVISQFYDLYVILFFYPLIYAAIVFRLKGIVISGLIFLAIVIPHSLPAAFDPNTLIRSLVLATFPFVIGGLVATQLNYLEQRLEALHQIERLNQELNGSIARLESTQKQLIHAARLNDIGQLAASVAHEINNPLAGVLVYSKLLSKKLGNDSSSKEEALATLAKIETAVDHCSRIIRGLLDFARQSEHGSQPVSLTRILDQSLSLTNHEAEMNHVKTSRQGEQSLPETIGDAGQLQQVFTNLILNAIQAMPQGGELTIESAINEQGWISVKVIDTGTGISAADMERLFTPFFTTKPPGKGLGLGLAVSYGIIEQHGGKITVQSKLGKGTTFTVSLPPRPPDKQTTPDP